MNQVQVHINKGREHQEMDQEESTGKSTETLLEIVARIEEEKTEAAAEKEEEIGMLIETTGQAMVGGDAEIEKVARSPWVMGGSPVGDPMARHLPKEGFEINSTKSFWPNPDEEYFYKIQTPPLESTKEEEIQGEIEILL